MSRNPGEKAKREKIAPKLHLPNANYNNVMSLTIGCWDGRIKPHLTTLSAWNPLEEDTCIKALTMILSSYILSPPHGHPLGGRTLS